MMKLGEYRLLGQFLLDGLGHSKINHLGDGFPVIDRDQDVCRLEVDDPRLVGPATRSPGVLYHLLNGTIA
jgi:hypothetical protein